MPPPSCGNMHIPPNVSFNCRTNMEHELETVAEKPIDMLIKHCRMFLYGSRGTPELIINSAASDFYTFALLHLTCTMFLTKDSRKDVKGGVFHRILDPIGKSFLLRDIDNIFAEKVGKITLATYLKERRNLLATHRNLSFHNLSEENQEIVINHLAIEKFFTLMKELEDSVSLLLDELEKLKQN